MDKEYAELANKLNKKVVNLCMLAECQIGKYPFKPNIFFEYQHELLKDIRNLQQDMLSKLFSLSGE